MYQSRDSFARAPHAKERRPGQPDRGRDPAPARPAHVRGTAEGAGRDGVRDRARRLCPARRAPGARRSRSSAAWRPASISTRAARSRSTSSPSIARRGGWSIAGGREGDAALITQAREMIHEIATAWDAIGRRRLGQFAGVGSGRLHLIFAHLLDQRGALQGEHAGGVGDDAAGQRSAPARYSGARSRRASPSAPPARPRSSAAAARGLRPRIGTNLGGIGGAAGACASVAAQSARASRPRRPGRGEAAGRPPRRRRSSRPAKRIAARSTKLRSSRTLPGQPCSAIRA